MHKNKHIRRWNGIQGLRAITIVQKTDELKIRDRVLFRMNKIDDVSTIYVWCDGYMSHRQYIWSNQENGQSGEGTQTPSDLIPRDYWWKPDNMWHTNHQHPYATRVLFPKIRRDWAYGVALPKTLIQSADSNMTVTVILAKKIGV